MVKRVIAYSVVALAVGSSALCETAAPRSLSGFEQLKSLQGDWAGPATWDQVGKKGSVAFKVSYRVVASGKVVAESMFAGTPGEMLTMYHLEGPDLVLVHYCSAGNQPKMRLEAPGDPGELAFRCVGGTNMKESDSHMHSARIRIVDGDHIQATWTSAKDGTLEWTADALLERVK
jgi:hypothetical protein